MVLGIRRGSCFKVDYSIWRKEENVIAWRGCFCLGVWCGKYIDSGKIKLDISGE
jgi:hypothetical protein